MRKSIELGRAVLSTPAVNLELWLRTLITISPRQQCTDLEQHYAAPLLDILTSGNVWVGRGNGLYIDLEITFKGQPVADEQLRLLSEAILGAPAWKQLGLQPSLPHDTCQSPGKLRIIVNCASECAALAEKKRHRVLTNTSAADVRPPEGLHSLSLDSVVLSVDIFELAQRRRVAPEKRLKVLADNGSISRLRSNRRTEDLEQDVPDELLLEAIHTTSLSAPSWTLKRQQTSTTPWGRETSSFYTLPSAGHQEFRLATAKFDIEIETPTSNMAINIDDLGTLIDGAFRVSVLSRINSKMVPGVKVKANTFKLGLADIAPILWKPGYLWSLSQRADLVPVIVRSLCQTATTTKTISSSFREKLSLFARPLMSLQHAKQTLDCEATSVMTSNHLASSVASQLWVHLQGNVPCKSATVLQSFVVTGLPLTAGSQTDEILENSSQEGRLDDRSSLVTVDPARGKVPGSQQFLEIRPTTPVASYCILPQHATHDHSVIEADNEVLFGHESFEFLDLVTYCGNGSS